MTAITSTHMEWAVVDRLRAMLAEPPHAQYNVTQAYGLCVAILAWVMQRIRTPEGQAQSTEARAAVALKKQLEKEKVESSPWNLQTSSVNGSAPPAKDLTGCSVFDFLVWLRDASCHGDSRNVTALNNGEFLTGFKFKARCNGRSCSVNMTEGDLRRIGVELATRYCDALQTSSNFVADAQTIREGDGA